MNAVRFFTDEDVFADVAPALRRGGIDAVSTPEAERRNAYFPAPRFAHNDWKATTCRQQGLYHAYTTGSRVDAPEPLGFLPAASISDETWDSSSGLI